MKIVVVGNQSAGKSTILNKLFSNVREDYEHTAFDSFSTSMTVDGNHFEVTLAEAQNPQEAYDRLRYLSYEDADAFLLVLSVDDENPTSTVSYWSKELKEHRPNIPIILVGNKIDLRSDDSLKDSLLTPEAGQDLAQKFGCQYIEISAKDKVNIEKPFEKAISAVANEAKKNKNKTDIIQEIDKYKTKRESLDTYTSKFGLFKFLYGTIITPFKKEQKLAAAEALKKVISGEANPETLKEHIGALSERNSNLKRVFDSALIKFPELKNEISENSSNISMRIK
ncbi:tRNA modification GTPase TrmE [Legionella gratiana]|uniref:tRNA modification GTPase TrmE n=1 Tax=Legionella gratiana TaxID=45066 RepID=A0A378JB84_9GAMM|nr:GTP-binding protein [Legionella gratiana]KTD15580.1 tRNA modification GTPase TrmE [Legionella gratiana]STX45052.1 tRNA modification GTPase TrmE [Legionella gratiana]